MTRTDALVALSAAILANPAINPLTVNFGDVANQAARIADRCLGLGTDAPSIVEPAPEPVAEIAPRLKAPTTGKELYVYATTCKTDPFLQNWITEAFAAEHYPRRLQAWCPEQVARSWPRIRAHLLELKAANNGVTK